MLRATLKSLLSRKARLLLSGIAVILGVMFVAGSFVLTDTLGRSFDAMFQTAYKDTDAQVDREVSTTDDKRHGTPADTAVDADMLTKVRGISGVQKATGQIMVSGTQLVGKDGKTIVSFGAPQIGHNWTGVDDFIQLRSGRAPAADNEIVVNAALAKQADVQVGQQVKVMLSSDPNPTAFTLVGISCFSGNRDSLGGASMIGFTERTAQTFLLHRPGAYSSIQVKATAGTSQTQLQHNLRDAVGTGYRVQTGAELTAQQSNQIRSSMSFFNKLLIGFAGVALFVGCFLIINTFSIIIAQRTKELALLRAIGGSRPQVIRSVLVEAFVIAVLSSTLGLAAGYGAGAGLAKLMMAMQGGGNSLTLATPGMPLTAVLSGYGVGIVVTMIAAVLPAIRASRIAPIAAMQESAAATRSLTGITIAGSVVSALGATVLGLGLAGTGDGNTTMVLILGGLVVCFIGITLLTPIAARPVSNLIGRLFSWSVPGKLGRLNSGRTPGRTALTASALMVGLALITGVSTILTSAKETLQDLADTQIKAELFVFGTGGEATGNSFDPAMLKQVAALPEVKAVVGEYDDEAELTTGTGGGHDSVNLSAVTDLPTMVDLFSLKATAGTLGSLGPDQAVLDDATAKKYNLQVGSTARMKFSSGNERTITIAGVYAKSEVAQGWVLGESAATQFENPRPSSAFIKVKDGASVPAVKTQIDRVFADYPRLTTISRQDIIDQQSSQFDLVLTMVRVLLGLAILIAVLGVVNTMALSVLERTRELGMLRAIGLRRGQTMWMITVEALIISLFGALLGLAVGSGIGAAAVEALRDQGFKTLAFPLSEMGLYLVIAAVVGVVAAIVPGIRAARTNVLAAIAHD